VIGAGTYCSRLVGVSMTGVGERMLVLLSAKRLCDIVGDGKPLDRAARAVMAEIGALAEASAGLIAVDVTGAVVSMHDTPFMAFAQRG
jgi:isoaspartyl peptidase/L-asparaginase-like protein (Ntn-hydrolase superfamily)